MQISFVKGIPPALFKQFIDYQASQIEANFVYALRWNSDLESYFNSYQLVSEYAWAGVVRTLAEYGFERVKKIEEYGQFAVTGDRISFWQPGFPDPVRMNYFGDELESIERYDLLTGRKLQVFNSLPAFNLNKLADKTDWENINWSLNAESFVQRAFVVVPLLEDDGLEAEVYDFIQPQLYFRRFDLLEKDVEKYSEAGFSIKLLTKHVAELPSELRKYLKTNAPGNLPFADLNTAELGFISNIYKFVLLTDRELLGTIFLSQRKQKGIKSSEARKLLSQLEGEIEIGNYLVHEDYGVGIYRGFVVEDGLDYLKLEYANNDELFVPLEQVGKLTKYLGEDYREVQLTRLGKTEWETLRRKVKASVAIAAKDLARHYAMTQVATATAIETEDTEGYKDFLQKFPYQPTPDQAKSEKEIIEDMAKAKPMNRLLIGDVGYGKTELMLRAAYKMAEADKQVVVLCPTTVLALQHYQNFKQRFNDTPFNIALVSRHNSTSENKRIVEQINTNKYDIIIGTHRLLTSDVQPENLGLLIVDEEQRFGVKQKEKIRKLEYGVHTLYVSATPIPRTLSMALAAIQDISIIQTAPPGRLPVETHVDKLSWNQVAEALMREKERGGQIFFVHNEVRTLASVQSKLLSLAPNVSVQVAHGQMSSEKLDTIMTDFYEHKFDCLLATTIIENGLDISNVNTIVVDKAERLGLSQMYQLRGRVGRSKRQAYAYFFYRGKGMQSVQELQDAGIFEEDETQVKAKNRPKYLERLEAILGAQELGAGFRIASRDLEIRGAGNLLGKEQHGNIQKVGYGLYMQLLAEEVENLSKTSA